MVASQELDSHLYQVWDVDHDAKNLLLEARPDWSHGNFPLYPQIVFEHNGLQIRGDYDEILEFGLEGFSQLLTKSAVRAFRHFKYGEKGWLNVERVDQRMVIAEGYRYPPRVFTRHSLGELVDRLRRKKGASFDLRYLSSEQCRHALNELDNWSPTSKFRRFEVALGSYRPPVRHFYDVVKVLRALAKIALNVLSVYCPNTPLSNDGFQHVVKAVTEEGGVAPKVLRTSGFVWASDIKTIAVPDCHSMRLRHIDGEWQIATSYFGGRIGTLVRFAGPNHESWSCADIEVPLHSLDWKADMKEVLLPLNMHVEWKDISKIIPSIEIENVKGEWRSL